MAFVKTPFSKEPMRESTLYYTIGTAAILAITLGAELGAFKLDEAHNFLKHGGSLRDLSLYPFLSLFVNDHNIEHYGINIGLPMADLIMLGFPIAVMPHLMRHANQHQIEENTMLSERAAQKN